MAGGKKGKTEAKSKGGPKEAPKGGKGNAKKDNSQATPAPAKAKGAQKIWPCHILCDKHSKREEALEELRNGTSWEDVCTKYSTEKARSGGKLGEKLKGQLEPEFEVLAFALPVFKATESKEYPYGLCKTVHGYHIIKLDKKQ
ncbi:hypothetical protein JX265_009682 [Neoarthrinium moseri]|uniref:Peptidyl-prolyl cis-trans isomerase n=1 Tax=Neoarthrinium moseri TaxID=1658444 RepID=A0A9P9WFM7_9PEZI|nr:hypothetical protein JX265_009682 [Neoarthrinium moseri]